ncbi:replication factor C small subunit 2 [Halodesulfurarchaeum formicicum]|uniref:Replication factor C small subunit n=1 Tax=Halodesulfurarchaeum formicicum TaxID=1873524 RepID=A0A1D8S1X6_9EURY|nr:AAA family ATPase [Halodesulfurarchaeum formicicum]AOW79372.1 replication factor C small subunit 2 [Halodesulfurarchaeum formicicum]APE94634.1 replication factor C small subunit 2 [Halodesulfurarchaeum formicicum]
MERPLWIDRHAPELSELPQEPVRERLTDAVSDPVNLVLHGPAGVGKTAAVRALAEAAHEDPEGDLIEINVADFFGMTKAELSEDPRFERFITPKRKRNSSKADLINYVLTESASHPPVSGSYNTILLDNAEAIREDFQQALRRVMEQYYEATQFVLTTRQPSKLISPIRSRCVPIPMRAPTREETVSVLADIAEAEGVDYDEEGLSYLASYAEGDLREAILAAQTAAEKQGELLGTAVLDPLQDVGLADRIEEMLAAAEDGQFTDARSILDDLLVEEGRSGEELLEELLAVARTRYSGDRLATLHAKAGEIEFDLTQGTSDRIHLAHLLSTISAPERERTA